MNTKCKPASPEELAARGVLPVEPEVAEAAPVVVPVEPKPKTTRKQKESAK